MRLPLLPTDATGLRSDWIVNSDGTYTVETIQDVEPLLDANKAMANHNDGYSPSHEWRRAASIPAIVLLQWREELGGSDPLSAENRLWLLRRLNDPDWRYLRTAPGVL